MTANALPSAPHPPRIALVGDRSPAVEAHQRIATLLADLNRSGGDAIEPYWQPSATIGEPDELAGFDGIWVVPGSPYASATGVLTAIRTARVRQIPFLGTCGGFQHALIEFARNVCGLAGVEHAELAPTADELLVVPLECSLLGEEAAVSVRPGRAPRR